MRVLVVEDDPAMSQFICEGLRDAGYELAACASAEEAHATIAKWKSDVVILDRMLASAVDGITLLQQLRNARFTTPVIILSALNSTNERIHGLRSGADDYLPKPFEFGELLARVESLLRRSDSPAIATTLQVADLVLDVRTMRATRAGQSIHLQVREFRLLEYLMRHEGQVITRKMLLENVWKYHFDPQSNITDVQIMRLRNKIDKGFLPQLIHTIRGNGYLLSPDPLPAEASPFSSHA